VAKPLVRPELAEPKMALEKSRENVIFGELISWGVREAISE
jgi:hypothetical protein